MDENLSVDKNRHNKHWYQKSGKEPVKKSDPKAAFSERII